MSIERGEIDTSERLRYYYPDLLGNFQRTFDHDDPP